MLCALLVRGVFTPAGEIRQKPSDDVVLSDSKRRRRCGYVLSCYTKEALITKRRR